MEIIDYLNIYLTQYAGKKFEVALDSGDVFTICFDVENFPHLLGIHYCYPKEHKNIYSGMSGVHLIQSGDITLEKMKTLNFNNFDKKVSKKIDAFDSFTDLFPNKTYLLEAAIFDKNRLVTVVDRELDNVKLIISSKQNPLIKYVFMFGKSNDSTPYIYPISFRKETNRNLDYYDLQTKHKIISVCEAT